MADVVEKEEIAALRAENESAERLVAVLAERIKDYRAENERLREALSFYAEYDNYSESYIGGERVRSSVEIDGGEKAIAALQSNGGK